MSASLISLTHGPRRAWPSPTPRQASTTRCLSPSKHSTPVLPSPRTTSSRFGYMPHTPHYLVHQRSESSFLLVRPVSPSVQDPLPTWPTSPWHYVVPALALIDLFTTIVLGGLFVRTEERVLLGWGLVRAGIVGQVGWTRSRSSVRGGAGWVAGEICPSLSTWKSLRLI